MRLKLFFKQENCSSNRVFRVGWSFPGKAPQDPAQFHEFLAVVSGFVVTRYYFNSQDGMTQFDNLSYSADLA